MLSLEGKHILQQGARCTDMGLGARLSHRVSTRVVARRTHLFGIRRNSAGCQSVNDIFQQLRELKPPHDCQQLAKLSATAAVAARRGLLSAKQAALLAYRLEGAGWFSIEVCQALGDRAERYVQDLAVAEWLVILRYFACTGFTQPNFAAAAALWLSGNAGDPGGSGQLQLPQLQELAATLAHTGHLSGPAADAVMRALSHLPPEPDTGSLVKLTACLAAADAGQSDFYQNVVASVSRLKTSSSTRWAPIVEELDSGDFWRLSLLFLLAKADVTRWPLVLNILRKLDPRVARAGLPASLVPLLARQLRLAAAENEAILLEARPLARELCRAAEDALSDSKLIGELCLFLSPLCGIYIYT